MDPRTSASHPRRSSRRDRRTLTICAPGKFASTAWTSGWLAAPSLRSRSAAAACSCRVCAPASEESATIQRSSGPLLEGAREVVGDGAAAALGEAELDAALLEADETDVPFEGCA